MFLWVCGNHQAVREELREVLHRTRCWRKVKSCGGWQKARSDHKLEMFIPRKGTLLLVSVCRTPASPPHHLFLPPVSVHFNKQEFICRLGVWLGSQVRFLSKGLFVCVPYNIVFKLFKFLCELSPSLQTIRSWRRLRKQLQPHLKSDCHGKVLTLGELGSNTHREGERVELSQEPKWQCQPSCRLPPSLTAPTVRLF